MKTSYAVTLFFLVLMVGISKNATPQDDLKNFLAEEKARLGQNHPGYQASPNGAVCQAMRSVGLGCSYNERAELVIFLYRNGVTLFPCKGGSNPYTKDSCMTLNADEYNYIGQSGQNSALAAMINKNQKLFSGGNLTAENAKRWRR